MHTYATSNTSQTSLHVFCYTALHICSSISRLHLHKPRPTPSTDWQVLMLTPTIPFRSSYEYPQPPSKKVITIITECEKLQGQRLPQGSVPNGGSGSHHLDSRLLPLGFWGRKEWSLYKHYRRLQHPWECKAKDKLYLANSTSLRPINRIDAS